MNGAVTITDGNATTASDTIKTVTISNFGHTTVVSSVLETVNVVAGPNAALASGSLTLNTSATDTSTASTSLTVSGSGYFGGMSGSLANLVTSLDLVATDDLTITNLSGLAAATTVTASGAGITTLKAHTGAGAVTNFTSTGGGLDIETAIGTGVTFTGGAGKDGVVVAATTKAISMGAGDDTGNHDCGVGHRWFFGRR